ncbi:hypothetical protein MYK68_18715 [Gordonia sp. PP30]|uniref:hypothetical protein n=1 Tax=unclassified Gordonia (in: high G+C Gram-positive bacteria) TaxID=2657482 RepID=UPI001FFFCB34|nr:hypothetical protein [Gordonia sp. PP30]UQE74717.1 hypothetical protein MYK68_18715 [Gordonia sp. PP30]
MTGIVFVVALAVTALAVTDDRAPTADHPRVGRRGLGWMYWPAWLAFAVCVAVIGVRGGSTVGGVVAAVAVLAGAVVVGAIWTDLVVIPGPRGGRRIGPWAATRGGREWWTRGSFGSTDLYGGGQEDDWRRVNRADPPDRHDG